MRTPAFRSVKRGYDPDEVDAHVAWVRGAIETLRARMREAERRRAQLGAVLSEPAPAAAPDVDLVAVIQEGERAGDALLARAEACAEELRRNADRRIAELRDDADLRALDERVRRERTAVEELEAACEQLAADLDAVGAHVTATRAVVVDGIDTVLSELAGAALQPLEHT